eukprot:TRINITY_DN11476_c0_g1_i1.p1 TRINITY_DN11476_c0_g1~~TRINITY_DN11476_c0_g1_i1.p1  ORF type:complete len:1205 (-),score=342.70 TRINITY_DN11476_c0_g1_i1:105-3719(-)
MQGFLLLFLALLCLSNGQSLQDIQQRLTAFQHINQTTVGKPLAGFINSALHEADLPLSAITSQITGNLLTVKCSTLLGSGATVSSTYHFWMNGNTLAMDFQFEMQGSIQNVYTSLTHSPSLPQSIQGLSTASGSWLVSGVSASGGPLGTGVGLTIQGTSSVVGGKLLSAVQKVTPKGTTQVPGHSSVFIPNLNASDVILNFTTTDSFTLSKSLTLNYLELLVQKPFEVTFSIHLLAAVSQQSLEFALTADYDSSSSSVKFSGDLLSQWQHPLGLKWLTLLSGDATFVIDNKYNMALSLEAQSQLSWSSHPVTVDISLSGDKFEDILFEITNIAEAQNVAAMFAAVSGKTAPSVLSEITTATGTLAISTYATGNFREGFNFLVDATLTSGSLLKAAQVLDKQATPSTFNYAFTLYVPIFASQKDIEISLKETGSPFTVVGPLVCSDFTINIDVNSGNSNIVIDADLSNKLKDGTVLQYTVSADWEESSANSVEFKGVLSTAWNNPFGWSWMIVESGSDIDLKISTTSFDLTFDGTVQFPWSFGMSSEIFIEIGGPQMADAVFAIENFPLNTLSLDTIFQYIIGSVPKEINGLNPQGTVSISIATWDSSKVPLGFTLNGQVTVTDAGSGDLWKALSLLSADPSTITFTWSFNIALFGSNPTQLELQFSESGAYHWTKEVEIDQYTLDVKVGPQSSFAVTANAALHLPEQSTPLQFQISSDFEITDPSFSFTGSLTNWVHPWGQKWFNLTSLQLSIDIGSSTSVSLSGDADFLIKGDKGTADASISVQPGSASLSFDIDNHWTIDQLTETVLGKSAAAVVKDIETKAALKIGFSLSTSEGITFSAIGNVTGTLAQEVKHVSYWWDHPGNCFGISVSIPIFSAAPEDLTLALDVTDPYIQISDHFWFDSTTFSISVAPFAISLDAKVKAQFNKNPVLYFEVDGTFKTDGTALVWGAMEGTWDNPFGIKHFDLSNVILQIGFNPADCATSACIADLGLGAEMEFAKSTVTFDGNVAIPDLWDIFFSGSYKKKGQAVAVTDVIDQWNAANTAQISKVGIPESWGINDASFYFAPINGQFGPLHYAAGFGVTGDLTILDMNIFMSMNCTEASGFSCNFAFDISVPPHEFSELLKKELHLMYPDQTEFTVFKLVNVGLGEWSQQNVAATTNPRWQIGLEILNKVHNLDFRVDQSELSGSFHDFFVKWLKHLF